MSGQGRKSHPLAGFSGWLSHPGCPSLSWVLGIVGQGTTLPIPPLLNNLRRPLVSSWVITVSVTNRPDYRLLKACEVLPFTSTQEHCLLGENSSISCLRWWESKGKHNRCVFLGEGQVLVSKQADLGMPRDSLLGGLLTHPPLFSMNREIIPQPQSPLQSDLRKLHVHEEGKNTHSLGLSWRDPRVLFGHLKMHLERIRLLWTLPAQQQNKWKRHKMLNHGDLYDCWGWKFSHLSIINETNCITG